MGYNFRGFPLRFFVGDSNVHKCHVDEFSPMYSLLVRYVNLDAHSIRVSILKFVQTFARNGSDTIVRRGVSYKLAVQKA